MLQGCTAPENSSTTGGFLELGRSCGGAEAATVGVGRSEASDIILG